jgi:hypothetical protein
VRLHYHSTLFTFFEEFRLYGFLGPSDLLDLDSYMYMQICSYSTVSRLLSAVTDLQASSVSLKDLRLLGLPIRIECHMHLILPERLQASSVSNISEHWKTSVWLRPRSSECKVMYMYASHRASFCPRELQAWYFQCLAPSAA